MTKKVISLILAFALMIATLPATVFATLVTIEEIDAAIVLNGYTDAQIKAMPLQDVLDLLQDTEGNPIEIAEDAKVVWAHFKDNEGNVIRDEYHVIERNENVDLSEFSYTTGYTMELIVGSGKQLDADNKRYIVRVYVSDNVDEKLEYELYKQDNNQIREKIVPDKINTMVNNQLGMTISTTIFLVPEHQNGTEYYLGISSVADLHPNISVEIYAAGGTLLNDVILNKDMKVVDAGYRGNFDEPADTFDALYKMFNIVYKNDENNIIKDEFICFTVVSDLADVSADIFECVDNQMTDVTLFEATEAIINDMEIDFGDGTVSNVDSVRGKYFMLQEGYSADEEYYCALDAHSLIWDDANAHVEKAVVGHYDSLEAAADQEDIKEQLIPVDRETVPLGYKANYNYENDGVNFTVFFDDGNIWKFNVRIMEYDPKYDPSYMPDFDAAPIVGAKDPYFRVDGVKYGNEVLDTYVVENGKAINMDTLYGYGYQTLFINDIDVDLTQLKPTFWFGNEDRVHTTYVGTKQESGVSIQDFSNGAVQYGTIIDNNEKNYNVTFAKKETGAKLFVNGPAQREILLDEYFEHKHDILIANVGTEELTGITVTLDATNVKLDDYWTVGGEKNNSLAAFTTTVSDSDYGELDNIGKIRLLPDGDGEIEGTLTISADGQEDVIINLTGRASNPTIVTETLENNHAVKYVPYAYLISTNNMNDWNEVDFQLVSGELPDGVTLNEKTGEIYGVPTETGEFTFTVQADYSYEGFESSQKEFTLTVDNNTDENVAAQIDEGYEIKVPIPETVTGATDLVWEIEYDYTEETAEEFKGVWLDGEKLAKDVDYTVESGSTKITIKSQTVKNTDDGKHTIAVEYRTSDTNEVKKSAQNYTKQSSTNNNTGSSGGGGTTSYKVWFEVNGGAWLDAVTVKRNNTLATVPTPEKAGYVFDGWYKDAALTQKFDASEKITKTTTLYAKWIELCKVWLIENGGEEVADIDVQIGNTVSALPTPVKSGYVFNGWYKDETLTQKFDTSEPINASISLYAMWVEDKPPVDASGFIDVTKEDWFYDDVQWAYENELMVGISNLLFAPKDDVTGGMVVAVLARLADVDVSEYEDTVFEDVYEGQWYTPYAKWAKSVGLVDGIPFNPPAEISREWMGIVLTRFLDYMNCNYSVDSEIIEFADADLISDEAMDAMQTLFKLEIFRGKGNNIIDPVSNTTRAEFAALIHRVDNVMKETLIKHITDDMNK